MATEERNMEMKMELKGSAKPAGGQQECTVM